MNERERALTALRHQEADRVPIDFGGTVDSGISALGYQDLRAALNLPPSVTRIQDVQQMTALIEDDVRKALRVDTSLIVDLPRRWRQGSLPDGSSVSLPADFLPERQPDGSEAVLDSNGNVLLRMPEGGYYFDSVYSPLANATNVGDIEQSAREIEEYDQPSYLDVGYAALGAKARELRAAGEGLVVGFFGGHIFQAAQSLRGWEEFLIDLLDNRRFAMALLDRLTEANIRRFGEFTDHVGQYLDVVQFEDDLGMQDRTLLEPELYRKVVKPYHARLFGYVKSHCDAFILLHTDGAVAPLIPDFIEMGVDALNPVQVSAAGMDTHALKTSFGREIAFWGGGCDSQQVLPFGTPEDVRDEVHRRIDDLAGGGGFIFSPIHNIQAGVPVRNVLALFEAAAQYGRYG